MKKSPHPSSVFVTDLDNTLFDWYAIWYHPPAVAMLDGLLEVSVVDEELLLSEIKGAHEMVLSHRPALDYDGYPDLNNKPCPCCHSKVVTFEYRSSLSSIEDIDAPS